jgi:alpha-1,3-glucosyltransferase
MTHPNAPPCGQYNNVCLGLSALGVAFLLRGHEFLGSVTFSLALNFKQMALYYAPAFGVYLLARCIYRPNALLHVAKLGIAVVVVFAVMWFPFCASPFTGETCASSMAQGERSDRLLLLPFCDLSNKDMPCRIHSVLRRIFPFGRGLFEDKVANFWCIVDFVAKIRRQVDATTQMRLWCEALNR